MRSHATIAGLALLLSAAAPAAEMTWQEANKKSADLIRNQGDATEAADLAYQAFELYGEQSQHYAAANQAQLLMNAIDARLQTQKLDVAIRELKRGIDKVEKRAPDDPVLVSLYEKAIGTCTSSTDIEAYYEKASALAEKAWGYGNEHTVAINLAWVRSFYFKHDERWMARKVEYIRARATQAGAEPMVLLNIDLGVAQSALLRRNYKEAANLYLDLMERSATLPSEEGKKLLSVTYSELRNIYEYLGDRLAVQALDKRAAEDFGIDTLKAVKRLAPAYPRNALRDRIGGSVTLKLEIAPDGSVEHITVLQSIPGDVFVSSAVDAVRKWVFTPKIVDGKAVAQTGIQRFDFRTAD